MRTLLALLALLALAAGVQLSQRSTPSFDTDTTLPTEFSASGRALAGDHGHISRLDAVHARRDGVKTRTNLDDCSVYLQWCLSYSAYPIVNGTTFSVVSRYNETWVIWLRLNGGTNITFVAGFPGVNMRVDLVTNQMAVYFPMAPQTVYDKFVTLYTPANGLYTSTLTVDYSVIIFNNTYCYTIFGDGQACHAMVQDTPRWSVKQYMQYLAPNRYWYRWAIRPTSVTGVGADAYDYFGQMLPSPTFTMVVPRNLLGTFYLGEYIVSKYTDNPQRAAVDYSAAAYLYPYACCNSTLGRDIKISHSLIVYPPLDTDVWVGFACNMSIQIMNGPVSIPNTFAYVPTQTGDTVLTLDSGRSDLAFSGTNAFIYISPYFKPDGYFVNWAVQATAAGTTTFTVEVDTSAPSEFVSTSILVNTVNVHNYGTVTWTGVPSSISVYTTFTATATMSLPVVGNTRQLTITPITVGASVPATFTPSACTLSATMTSCDFDVQITDVGMFNVSFALSNSAAYQYLPPSSKTGSSYLVYGNVTAKGPAYVFSGTPRQLLVNVTRLPLGTQTLTVTPSRTSGAAGSFSPTSFTFDTNSPNFAVFTITPGGNGAFVYQVTSSGTALATYTIKNVTALSTTFYSPSTPVVSTPSLIIKSTATSVNVTLTAPVGGASVNITPSAVGAIFTPTFGTATAGVTKLMFSVTCVNTGPITFALAYAGTAMDQYSASSGSATVIDPPGQLTVNQLDGTSTVWMNTPRSFVISASPSTGYVLTITLSPSGSGGVTLDKTSVSFGLGVFSQSVTLTPTAVGSVSIAFTLSGNGSAPFIPNTPSPMVITVAAQDAQTFTAPSTVPPLSSSSFPITLSAAPLGQPVTVTPTVTVNSGTPSVLGGVVFSVGDTTLTRSFSFTPPTVGTLDISLSVTNPYGQYTTQLSGSTAIAFSTKAGMSTNIQTSVAQGVTYDVTVTLAAAPVAAVRVELDVTGGSVTGGSAGAGRMDFAVGATTASCRVTFSEAGIQNVTLDPYVDGLAQYARPATVFVQVNGSVALPGPPQSVATTSDYTNVNITWEAPSSSGGGPITGYTFTFYSDLGQTVEVKHYDTGAYEYVIYATGLTPSTTYFVSGVARNIAGTSVKSNRVQVVMDADPNAGASTTADGSGSSGASTTGGDAALVTGTGSAAAPPTSNTAVFAAIGAIVIILILIAVVVVLVLKRKKEAAKRERWASDNGATIQLDLSQAQGTKRYVERLLGQRGSVSIGRGGTAEVFKAKDEDGEYVAIKRLTQQHPKAMAEFHQEVTILSQLGGRNHPNVIGLKCFSDDPPCIVMELADGGSLYDLLKDANKLKSEKKVVYIYQVASGMNFLHACYVAHLDIKPRNILIGKNGTLKITDFGVSQPTDKPYVTTEFAGTPAYAPPERFQLNRTIDLVKSDVYSYGLTMWALLMGKEPYHGQSVDSIVAKHSTFGRTMDSVDMSMRNAGVASHDPEHTFPDSVPPKLRFLLQSTVSTFPESRPTFSEIVNGVRDCDWAKDVTFDDDGQTVFVPLGSGNNSALSSLNSMSSVGSHPALLNPSANPVFTNNNNLNTFDSAIMSQPLTSYNSTTPLNAPSAMQSVAPAVPSRPVSTQNAAPAAPPPAVPAPAPAAPATGAAATTGAPPAKLPPRPPRRPTVDDQGLRPERSSTLRAPSGSHAPPMDSISSMGTQRGGD